jgi:hypothetical protein
MKPFRPFSSNHLLFFTLMAALISCTGKKQPAEQPSDITGLKDFPKEWTLVEDISPPDSTVRQYVIPVDSSSSPVGSIIIKQNGNDWQMINSGFFHPGTYVIKNCKRADDGQMLYYDIDLQSTQDTTTLKFSVNFRQGQGDAPQVSIFTCNSCEDYPKVYLVDKEIVGHFPKKPLSELQYD